MQKSQFKKTPKLEITYYDVKVSLRVYEFLVGFDCWVLVTKGIEGLEITDYLKHKCSHLCLGEVLVFPEVRVDQQKS